jgi:hypothetical protein
MSRLRHTTLTNYLGEIRVFLKQARTNGARALRMANCRDLLETMTNNALVYTECSGIEVSWEDARGFIEEFLREVAYRHAQGFTLGRVRDEPLLLAESITDPCGRAHTVTECPKRRTRT